MTGGPLSRRTATLSAQSENEVLRAAMRKLAGPTTAEMSRRRELDKVRFHPDNPADYASHIGMPYEDENVIQYVCVGCWWCHHEEPGNRIARAALKALGEDY